MAAILGPACDRKKSWSPIPLGDPGVDLMGSGAPCKAGKRRGPPVIPSCWLSLSGSVAWHKTEVLGARGLA